MELISSVDPDDDAESSEEVANTFDALLHITSTIDIRPILLHLGLNANWKRRWICFDKVIKSMKDSEGQAIQRGGIDGVADRGVGEYDFAALNGADLTCICEGGDGDGGGHHVEVRYVPKGDGQIWRYQVSKGVFRDGNVRDD